MQAEINSRFLAAIATRVGSGIFFGLYSITPESGREMLIDLDEGTYDVLLLPAANDLGILLLFHSVRPHTNIK